MNNILKQIIIKKKGDLLEQKKLIPLNELKQQISKQHKGSLFYKTITRSCNNPAVIAEVKFRSPSAGNLGTPADLVKKVKQYEEAGADAISIITESHFFGGNIDFIDQVKKAVKLPILQKDFIIDEYQIYKSALIKSDALLLIARLIDRETLSNFVKLAVNLGIEPIVEVYYEEDLKKAVETETKFIAVNARDLDTFKININQACSLLKKIPDKYLKLGFSGIGTAGDIKLYKDAGARGILIGTSLMKTSNPDNLIKKISTYEKNNIKVKICGIKDLESAKTAIDSGADFLGFNFVKTSPRYIDPKKALEIIKKIKGKSKTVGVFQNEDYNKVNEIADLLDLDFVQLHGEEDDRYIKMIKRNVIKKFSKNSHFSNSNLRFLLLDRIVQGKGDMVDFVKAKQISDKFPVFFSGGLTPENVGEVVRQVNPFAVDVAGGVESNGKKDHAMIKAFIKNAKNP